MVSTDRGCTELSVSYKYGRRNTKRFIDLGMQGEEATPRYHDSLSNRSIRKRKEEIRSNRNKYHKNTGKPQHIASTGDDQTRDIDDGRQVHRTHDRGF